MYIITVAIIKFETIVYLHLNEKNDWVKEWTCGFNEDSGSLLLTSAQHDEMIKIPNINSVCAWIGIREIAYTFSRLIEQKHFSSYYCYQEN